ncbi:hypothetical protein ACVWYH_005653 [Bradyrhizobium sp. GM24.11]
MQPSTRDGHHLVQEWEIVRAPNLLHGLGKFSIVCVPVQGCCRAEQFERFARGHGALFRIADLPGYDFNRDVLVERGVQGAHYGFRWDGCRIGLLYDFSADRDPNRDAIIEGSKAA